jgi:hypothetical protein
MPSLAGFGALGLDQFLAVALFVAVAAAWSGYLVRKHRAADGGLPDAVFWDGFAGLAVLVPAVLVPSLASPGAGLALAVVALTTAAGGYRCAPELVRRQASRRAAREAAASDTAAALRHVAALARWQRYELDPGLCIDFPAMSDPAQPETAALLKAMRAAERARSATAGPAGTGYSAAVDRLEHALADAEHAAGALRQPVS